MAKIDPKIVIGVGGLKIFQRLASASDGQYTDTLLRQGNRGSHP